VICSGILSGFLLYKAAERTTIAGRANVKGGGDSNQDASARRKSPWAFARHDDPLRAATFLEQAGRNAADGFGAEE